MVKYIYEYIEISCLNLFIQNFESNIIRLYDWLALG